MVKQTEPELITIKNNERKEDKKNLVKMKKQITETAKQESESLKNNNKDDVIMSNTPLTPEVTSKAIVETNYINKLEIKEETKKEDAQYDFELPENKKSLSNMPFKIVEPNKETVIENLMIDNELLENEKPPKKDQPVIEPKNEKNQKTLDIEIVESPSLTVGTIIKMTPEGLVNSKRNIHDGHAFFGSYSGQDQYQINDFNFPIEEKGFGKRHFVIQYDETKDSYFLKDLSDGTGTFIKVNDQLPIVENIILSFNNVHLAIMVPSPQEISEVKDLEPDM